MIVWIDGTFGVGKSTVALEIKEKMAEYNVTILDSDFYYQKMAQENPFAIMFGGTSPQNNIFFLNEFKKIIEKELKSKNIILIIVMALTRDECKKCLLDYFVEIQDNIKHIILNARKETICERVKSDLNPSRSPQFSLEYLEENIAYLEKNFSDAI